GFRGRRGFVSCEPAFTSVRLRITRSLEAATDTRPACDSGGPARWKAVSGRWPRRPMHGASRARAVGDRCPDVAEVEWSCGRWHSGRCPRPPACCRAPVGRCHVVLGTFLHAVEVWEGALGVLPGSSGVLPGTGRPLPRRTWYVSSRRRSVGGGTRRVARVVWRVAGLTCAVARCPSAVTRAVLHTLIPIHRPAASGRTRRAILRG